MAADLNYVTQTDKNISVTFGDMPKDPALVFVNVTSGKQTDTKSTILQNGGSGSGDVAIGVSLSGGAYCLLAQTRDKTPKFIAQTVVFYLHPSAASQAGKAAKTKKTKKSKR